MHIPGSETTPDNQAQQVTKMAAVFDPWAQVQFNLSREYVLSNPIPPVQIADTCSHSTTKSVYRLHWNGIGLWNNFGNLVNQYWNNVVSQADKQQYVSYRDAYRVALQTVAKDIRVSDKEIVKVCIDTFPVAIHGAAGNGLNGATRPMDQHSKLQRWGTGIEGYTVAGIPDFVMATEYMNVPRRITVMVDVKNPWMVTPDLIDAVINSMFICSLPLIC